MKLGLACAVLSLVAIHCAYGSDLPTIHAGEPVSMTSTLNALKSIRGMSLSEIILVFPDGRRRSMAADEEALTTDAGMHVLRASFLWDGGESRRRAEVVIQKPFVVIGRSGDARGRDFSLESDEKELTTSREDAKDMIKLWLWFFALAALFFVWSAVTNCRSSGR